MTTSEPTAVVEFPTGPARGIQGRGQPSGEDKKKKDDADDSSVSSFLSSRSSSFEDWDSTCPPALNVVDPQMLKQHFAFRDQLLHRIQTEEKEDNENLREAEEVFRTAAMKYVSPRTEEGEWGEGDTRQQRTGLQGRNSLFQQAVFDLHYTVPGIANILLYCVAHLSMYELCHSIILELSKNDDETEDCDVYWCVLGLGLLLYRITGGVFYWLDDESYEHVRVELKNRLHSGGKVEASALRWFRRHNNLSEVVNLCAFYMCFICVMDFLHCYVLSFLDIRSSILATLPSVRQGVQSSVSQMIATGHLPVVNCLMATDAAGVCYEDNGFCGACGADLTDDDEDYLYSHVSVASYDLLMGAGAHEPVLSSTMTLLFYGILACLSFAAFRKLNCDRALF